MFHFRNRIRFYETLLICGDTRFLHDRPKCSYQGERSYGSFFCFVTVTPRLSYWIRIVFYYNILLRQA